MKAGSNRVTIPATAKNPTKQVFLLSPLQVEVLGYERFDNAEAANAALSTTKGKVILDALVAKELFKASATGIYTRTALGGKVAGIIAERIG